MCEGSGESGKSTFVKQMRIIHGKGYSEADRMEFRTPIFENIVSSMQATLEAMKRLSIDVTDKSLEVRLCLVWHVFPWMKRAILYFTGADGKGVNC